MVNGELLLSTSNLTIGKTKIDANVDHTSLLPHVVDMINFTNDYAISDQSNTFYYVKTSYSADKKHTKYDYATSLADTSNITDYDNHQRMND